MFYKRPYLGRNIITPPPPALKKRQERKFVDSGQPQTKTPSAAVGTSESTAGHSGSNTIPAGGWISNLRVPGGASLLPVQHLCFTIEINTNISVVKLRTMFMGGRCYLECSDAILELTYMCSCVLHHAYVFLVLVFIKGPLTIKRMLSLRHPYTRASFLCKCLQADIGRRMLSSPPASLLPKYGRNRMRVGRRTKTQPKKVIRANVCLVRRPCQNQFIADTHQ